MNDKFFDLKKDKQDRMINAALKIFSANSYRHSSTDHIVKEAGISKGLLFHYFVSKAGLYEFIYDYSVKYISMELYQTIGVRETDYFELLRQKELACLRAMKQYPYMPVFLERADIETEAEAVCLIEAQKEIRLAEQKRIMEQADLGALGQGEDEEAAVNMINYTVRGIKAEYYSKNTMEAEEMFASIVFYLDYMKRILSKQP